MEHPFKFKLDSFQEEAISHIAKDENVLITAKTGSGKTLVGEYQIWRSLNKGKRVFYTTPIKSLSNQKFHDLKKEYGDRVGIMTGDIKFSPHADIVIMTTEILRNLLYKQGTSTENIGISAELSLHNLDSVVFDEVHYINDPARGNVWEECLVLLPPEINLVLLSATLDTPQPFVNWLSDLKKKPCHLISTEYRVVPLVHQTESGEIIMDSKDNFNTETYKAYVRSYYKQQDELRKHGERVRSREEGQVIERETRVGSFVERMNGLIMRMDKPALFFVFSRKMCEEYASKVMLNLIDSSDSASVRHIVNYHLRNHTEFWKIAGYHKLLNLVVRGIAFHHSGMLPILKEIVEILFGKGFIKVLFATETFAVGINMPTKTVVFTSYRKFDDDRDTPRMLTTSEYIQMAGRAGRRGKDDKGIVIYLPIREPESPEEVRTMMTGKRATVESQMKFDYSYILATLNSGKYIQGDTYWRYQAKQELGELDKEIAVLMDKQFEIVQELDTKYHECKKKDEISTRLKHSVNAEKKKYQVELSKWENSHMGRIWVDAWKKYGEVKSIESKLQPLTKRAAELEDFDGLLMRCRYKYLTKHGYIDEDDKLTTKGLIASEIHEGHPLLMTELYDRKILELKDGNTIVETLSCFLEEPQTEEGIPRTPIIDSLRVVAKFMENDSYEGDPPEYWKLTDYWVDVVHDWLNGDDYVCEKYGIEHGNFVRAMLKLANIVREWVNIATLKQDTEMVEKLIGMEQKLIRGFVVPDSLYLRL
jgi:superfamily II RNA helicase